MRTQAKGSGGLTLLMVLRAYTRDGRMAQAVTHDVVNNVE